MKTLYLKEGIRISKEELYSKLSVENENEVLNKLILAKIIKHDIPKENLDGTTTGQEYYVFNYVGIIVLNDITYVIYPKYINDISKDINKGHKKLRQIIKIIDKFQMFSIFSSEQESMLDNYLSIQIKIMQDFLQYGLYFNMNYVDEINGEGVINWERTINETQEYMVDGIPYYLDIFTQKTTLDETDIIRRIHKIILTQISQNIKPIISILGMPELILTDEELEDFGNQNYIESLFEQEISRQFIDDKRNILINLLEYIKKNSKDDYSNVDSIKFYGTTAFNLVWEDVCKKVYGDNLKDDLSSLDLVLKDPETSIDYSDRELLKDVVEKPLWTNLLQDNEVSSSYTYQLDVLHINHKRKTFDIYDAKYYQIKFQSDSINGQPGMADLTKQYFYGFAYKQLADINHYDINNYFVVPYDELSNDCGTGVEIAKAKLEILNLDGNKEIVVIARDCELIYTEYLVK